MPMPLDKWQEHLEKHFTELASARAKSGFPLFALEHGLTGTELDEIDRQLCAQIRAGSPLSGLWLVCVIFTTENGYDYDGGEYWNPIEERTIHWDLARRRRLRVWFKKFQETYGGVVPSGAWAEWFKNIAWPITHAIVPKYLQWQLAKALYDLRYRLTRLDALSPLEIGRLLSQNTWDASSRLREFLQQEELVGRLVLALLGERKVEGQSPIYEPTLKRLVSDLERVQSAREWLKETRSYVTEKLRGMRRGANPREQEAAHFSETRETADLPDIRPALMLRRSGSSSWSIVVEFQSLASVARLHPHLRTFLKATRCKIPGAGDTWLPMGWLATNSQKRVLKSWPGANVPLIKFERPDPIIDHLVNSDVRLSKGSIWLCRIGSDGLAHEIAGRIVRPGQHYIVLSESTLPASNPMLSECSVDCAGVNTGLLSVPDSFMEEDVGFLQRLGLEVARTVRIWPAGVAGRGWDGEGHSEWLTTEPPCFGIIHDHPLDVYSMRLDSGPETLVEVGSVKHPLFIKLPPLPAGRHTLSVKARRHTNTYPTPSSPPAEGTVALEVREPEPWSPGTTSYAGLAISIDPQDPSLDTFWEGDVGLSVLGPDGRQVACSIRLMNTKGVEILSEKIGTFDLPITTEAWQRRFKQFASDDSRAWAYLEAASGRFVITGDELGEYALRLERDVRPIHWVCRNLHRVTTVRLIDDTGRDDLAACSFHSFSLAATPTDLAADIVLRGYQMPPPGGLFVARHGDLRETIVVSTPTIEHDFRGLVTEPDLSALDSSVQIEKIFDLLLLWSRARVVGPLSRARRGRVVARLITRLFAKLCGDRWARAEAAFIANPSSASALQKLEQSVGGPQGFPAILRRDHEKMENTAALTQWYSDVARRYGICPEPKLCTIALRIACQPEHLLSVSETERGQLLRQVTDNVALLQGARLIAVLAANHNQESAGNQWQVKKS